MKRGGPTHPKIAALAERLQISRSHAVGLLECLFHWTAKYAPTGAIGKWTNQAIAEAVWWPQEDADRLVSALTDQGVRLVDQVDSGDRLIVHDWHEHADDAVHRTLARSFLSFANGEIPSLSRLAQNERASAEKFYKKRKNANKKALSTCAQNVNKKSTKSAPCLSLSLSLSPLNTDLNTSPPLPPHPRSTRSFDKGWRGDLVILSRRGQTRNPTPSAVTATVNRNHPNRNRRTRSRQPRRNLNRGYSTTRYGRACSRGSEPPTCDVRGYTGSNDRRRPRAG